MHSRALVGAAAVLVVLLSGCTSDPSSTGGDPGGPGSSTTPTTPVTTDGTSAPEPTTPTEPTETQAPSVTPATGPEIVVDDLGTPVLRLRLPDDLEWRIRGNGDAASSEFLGTGYFDINGRSGDLVTGKGLDFYARVTADSIASPGADLRRTDDRTVAGVDGFVLEGRDSSSFTYVFGGIYGEAQVDVIFELPKDNARARGWIESILASAEWL